LGAAYALELARDFPERIRGLVLVSPFFLQGRPSWPLRLPWVMAHAFRWLKRLGPALALGQAAASPRVDDAMTQLARPRVAKENARWLAWAAQARVRDALKETMDNLRVPVVLVHGEHDPLVVPTTKPYETHTIPDAGHYPQVTHPLAIARAVQQMQHAAAV
jgi:pimeloyl-ACP methyl ester carboxylesterase